MKIILIPFVLAFLQMQCFAQTFDPGWANRFQTVLDSAVKVNKNKGASAAVFVPGQGIWTGVSGISSSDVPITPDMRFGIASNTKLFVAVLMLKLQEQGVLSLNDPLSKWLPAYRYVDSNATIRQLLSHQSGIFDYSNDNFNNWQTSMWKDTTHFWTSQEVLSMIGPSLFKSGHGWSYSNTNYTIAAMIIESATGKTWVENLHTLILEPLKMNNIFVGAFEKPNGPVAHEWNEYNANFEIRNSPMISEFSMFSAAGAIFSTAGEMVQWYSNLFKGVIISSSSLKELLDFEPTSLFGLGIAARATDHPYYAHGGAAIGYKSIVCIDAQTKSVICILLNSGAFESSNYVFVALLEVLIKEYPKKQNDAGIISILSPKLHNPNSKIIPSVSIKNFGSDPLTSVTISYKIDNEENRIHNWSGTLTTDSSVNVTLPEIQTDNGYHIFTSYTSGPNGGMEGYTSNDTLKCEFITSNTATIHAPYREGFDENVYPPTGWIRNSNSVLQWGRTSLASLSGTSSLVSSNYLNPIGKEYFKNDLKGKHYDMDMPVVNISSLTNPALIFTHAYGYYSGRPDTLSILISSDYGVSWENIFKKGGNELKTAYTTNAFYPTLNQWKQNKISLTGYTGDVLIRFRNICYNGNNLYLDDVKIDQATAIDNLLASDEVEIHIYPNPAFNGITVDGLPVNSELRISDLTGRILLNQKTESESTFINLDKFPAGIYLLTTYKGIKKFLVL